MKVLTNVCVRDGIRLLELFIKTKKVSRFHKMLIFSFIKLAFYLRDSPKDSYVGS